MTAPGPAEPRYTRDELVDELGLTAEYAEKIWNAFGFARASTPDKIFTENELQALRLFAASAAAMPLDAQVATARAIGQTMSRLADWQADQLREFDRDPDVPWTIDQMSAALGQVQQLIWRRHLALALDHHIELESDESQDLVVGFADIVGYTSLSRRIALDELELLLASFEEETFDIVTRGGGHVIKTLGDAVMFTAHEPAEAATIAIAIHELSADDEIPPLRVGLARGRVLSRLGDVFGEPVNIAARLAGSARPGTTLVDDSVSAGLADDERFYLRSIPSLSVRGYRRLKAKTVEANKYYDGPVVTFGRSSDVTP
ncbi:adenylate/guanylate cyclase domain-containing protein [Gordonia sp. LSe1-13]|uniref:Adenylate/guanylate cyclase domain-containing protein n=1 Tax=Gordonia sesuvii TaxID=3116777 RepID=A0ABU7MB05_9ACTN|nr:adenylate/guanylate cyclase domain-containing protein [Gordonia sp. LSe1-13]